MFEDCCRFNKLRMIEMRKGDDAKAAKNEGLFSYAYRCKAKRTGHIVERKTIGFSRRKI